jgi:hypothetical protein
MKRFILTMFLAVGSLAVFSATGNAQVNRRYSANIPFDFSVGGSQFKAGEYTIGPLNGQSSADFLVLKDRSTGRIRLIGQAFINRYDPKLNGTLQFVKAGDEWVLSSIETGTFTLQLSGRDRGESKLALNRATSGKRTVSVQ